MKFRIAAACAALSLIASPAFAYVPITATLATPATSASEPIIDGLIWRCAAETCQARQADRFHFGVSTCKALARRVGRISAFTAGSRSLSAEELEQCNSVASS